MKVGEIISILDRVLKPELQDEYDNSGPQTMFDKADISSLMICLDIDRGVIGEAAGYGCGLIVSHHPVLFRPLRVLRAGDVRSDIVIDLIDRRMSAYAAHTNLDRLYHDRLARALGLSGVEPLFPPGPDMTSEFGFGSLARLGTPVPVHDLMERLRTALPVDHIIYAGDIAGNVRNIALINGAGSGMVERITARRDIDCIITGDVGHHAAKYATGMGMVLIDAGHFGTERILLGFLRDHIGDALTESVPGHGIQIRLSETESNPLRLYRWHHEP